MRTQAAVALIVVLMVGCSGPGTKIDISTPEGRKKVAFSAGQAASLSYLAGANPSDEEVAILKQIVDQVRDNVKGFEKKGFIGALPGIEQLVDKLLPKEEDSSRRMAAKRLAKMLLDELDKVFNSHPEWKDLSEEYAGLVGSFASGASAGLGS